MIGLGTAADPVPSGPGPGLARGTRPRAGRRPVGRVTVAACLAFCTCRCLVDDPTTALYALFAASALSEVTGRGLREVAAAVATDRVPSDDLAAGPDDALRMHDTWGCLL